MKHPRLSTAFVAASAASLLMASTLSYADNGNSNGNGSNHEPENYKCENYKAECPPPCPPILVLHDGFYVGAGVGYDMFRVRHRHNAEIVDLPTGLGFTHSFSFAHSANGWMGGLFAGYGRYFDCFYLGLEAFGNWSGAETGLHYHNNQGNFVHAKVRARGSYGVALLPGIKVNDSSLLYARLGYMRSNFRGSGNFTIVDPARIAVPVVVGPDVTRHINTAHNKRWINGFQYGIGLETYVAELVSVRTEFTHTSFNRRSANRFGVIGDDRFRVRNRFRPSNNEFMLSLIYHFC